MQDYANSVEPIEEIRKAERKEKFTKFELKEYRKYTAKISWLAKGTRPDLSYSALKLAEKNNCATIEDLSYVNKKTVVGEKKTFKRYFFSSYYISPIKLERNNFAQITIYQ